jgi:hypothetical protein
MSGALDFQFGPMPWPTDVNWQMRLGFLLILAFLCYAMKGARLITTNWNWASTDRPHVFWILASPNELALTRQNVRAPSVLARAVMWLGITVAVYWLYWQLTGLAPMRRSGLLMSYAALPILFSVSELVVALGNVPLLPAGRQWPTLHQSPWLARGVADFWGRRWNLWFNDWFRRMIFLRLRKRPVLALILVFALSGLMHEAVINVPVYFVLGKNLFGTMMLYFLLQAAGVLVERRFLRTCTFCRVAFAWLVVVGPAPLVMNEGLRRVLQVWVG